MPKYKTYAELLIGAGSEHSRRIDVEQRGKWTNLTTLDSNADHPVDVVHDLYKPLPFQADTFDEVHAYEVLEHVGTQGDYKEFFRLFAEVWRVLKPGGWFVGTVPHPSSPWAWGDPSHTRVLPPECFTFLSQQEYINQVGKTAMSDFRTIYKADYDIKVEARPEVGMTLFALQAIKPSRWQKPKGRRRG
jgi:SAM-dependent methyltransferase